MPEQTGGNIITLSTGVRLRERPFALKAITDAQREMERRKPQPPVVFMIDKGREEINEADPKYQAALAQHRETSDERLLRIVIALCTEIAELPDGFQGPHTEQTLADLAFLGVDAAALKGRLERYAAWVTYLAGPSAADWSAITRAVFPRAGTPESEVTAAQETFQGDAAR